MAVRPGPEATRAVPGLEVFRPSCQNFVTYTWTDTEPPGALLANALTNGSVEQGEVVDLDVASFVFAP
jgi:hypothetical protein